MYSVKAPILHSILSYDYGGSSGRIGHKIDFSSNSYNNYNYTFLFNYLKSLYLLKTLDVTMPPKSPSIL